MNFAIEPLPFCLCGCGRRVNERRSRYFSMKCVPREVRAASARRSRQVYTRKQRAKSFGAAWVRFKNSPQTREDFFAVVCDVANQWWKNGHGCASKQQERARRQGAAA